MNRTDPVGATSLSHPCSRPVWNRLVSVHHASVNNCDGAGSAGALSSYHHGVDFVIFSERQVIDFADETSDCWEYTYQRKLDPDEEENDQLDSCHHVESEGVGRESEDDMCWSTGHLFGLPGLCLFRGPCPFARRSRRTFLSEAVKEL